ncbi:glycoside hydrolase family 127 protein [Actinospica robiniae]|uniref:glycoside hydrolase family 127 protein n=1 Tax=Actinospica robiniae TaxID=304901 RepID=UPI00040217AC|nr:beta-L-arabinofuranosidase domain-containing protein [Actinospica robiniae]
MIVPPVRVGTALGPVRLTEAAHTRLRPAAAAVTGGFWGRRRSVIAEASIPQGPGLLESAGNLHNLRVAAGTESGEFRGRYPFVDSDVYKWLEAACWRLAEIGPGEGGPSARRLADDVERISALIAAAQQDDGYLNTWVQLGRGEGRWTDLTWGHELYCAGHLIQAGIAHRRATGRTVLFDAGRRFADLLELVFGPGAPGGIDGVEGHPEIETALVELYRETGEARYLALSGHLVDRRGHGLLGGGAYFQDRVPLRQAETVEGHAVRQLYLLAGATDVATETGESALISAVERMWTAMAGAKTHLTGGLGARHEGESFGDPYELPTEQAYCETCAAVASVHWNWRLSLLTGRARYADLAERTLFNALLAGVSLDGTRWLYVNPLQVRDGYTDPGGDKTNRRTRWFRCACCPPNVMRLLAALPHYLSSADADGVQIHQYAAGRISAEIAEGPVGLRVETDYPWHGTVRLAVENCPEGEWELALRLPHWCSRYVLRVAGRDLRPEDGDGWLRIRRAWQPGEEVELTFDLRPRLTAADPRADAVRGCVAIERGPLVYCVEEVDHAGGGLDRFVLDTSTALTEEHRPELLGGVVTVQASGWRRRSKRSGDWWPYRPAQAAPVRRAEAAEPGERLTLTAVPYYAWANREDGAMRVWLPTG